MVVLPAQPPQLTALTQLAAHDHRRPDPNCRLAGSATDQDGGQQG
jgi:hypothetical protein